MAIKALHQIRSPYRAGQIEPTRTGDVVAALGFRQDLTSWRRVLNTDVTAGGTISISHIGSGVTVVAASVESGGTWTALEGDDLPTVAATNSIRSPVAMSSGDVLTIAVTTD